MLVIGLTGGIGSGKTTVANLFADLGVDVIDTDQLSRDVTKSGQGALKKISEHFGPKILQSNGSLDRTALRKIIFTDDNARRWLEELLHPLIRAEMKRQIDSSTSTYCIVVIPLLIETKPNSLIDRILVVDTSEDLQLERTKKRDNSSEKEVAAILNTQVNREKRLAAAHDIIENHGSLDDLVSQVKKLHEFYMGEADARIVKSK